MSRFLLTAVVQGLVLALPTSVALSQSVVPSPYVNNPYLIGGSYGPTIYHPGQVGGALMGVAGLTQANNQYHIQIQQARLAQQIANQAALETRRKALEQWRYEQSLKPTLEDVREREQEQALRRARNAPPQTEIWSGASLNTLLQSIQRRQAAGLQGPLVPLDADLVAHIHLTDGTTHGDVGRLRDGGLPQWPLVLRRKAFEIDRIEIEQLAAYVFEQGRSGPIAAETLEGWTSAVKALENKVNALVKELTPTEFVLASRCVNELKGTVRALQNPTVVNQFNGRFAARGKDVAALVSQVTKQGLKFAPAAPGDEASYTALHWALYSYDTGLPQLASRGGGSEKPGPTGQ